MMKTWVKGFLAPFVSRLSFGGCEKFLKLLPLTVRTILALSAEVSALVEFRVANRVRILEITMLSRIPKRCLF